MTKIDRVWSLVVPRKVGTSRAPSGAGNVGAMRCELKTDTLQERRIRRVGNSRRWAWLNGIATMSALHCGK